MPADEREHKSPDEDIEEVEALAGVDRFIHEPARLVILALLSVVEKADFNYTLEQTGLSKGNLSVQMTKLEQAGYLTIEKTFVGRRPYTVMRISDTGRAAFEDYRNNVLGALGGLDKKQPV
jgi:DNA-binding MarR family transcriptional regulator